MSHWVLLRGLAREARHWGDFPDQLAGTPGVANQPMTLLDLPGNGMFCALPSPLSVRAMTDFCRDKLLREGVKPPYSLLALSLGGMVATDWAQRYPAEVERLVLINTSMRPYAGITQRLPPRNWPALLRLAARWQDSDDAEHTVHQLTCQRDAHMQQDIRQWRFIRDSAPITTLNAARQLWAAAHFACAPAPPNCPVLVLSSAGDRLVDPACSSQLARAWRAAHVEHPWAGHDLPHDDADWVCREVAGWLREPVGTPGGQAEGICKNTRPPSMRTG